MDKYVALLRGINISGKNKVPMKELKDEFEHLGYKDVTTYLNSGNVIFTSSIDDKAKANEELTNGLNALLVVVENYPDLKSSANFTQLSDELAGTENRISTARRDYNNSVKEYNLLIKKFPSNLLANMFGFSEEKYFEADEQKKDVPNVSFD